MNFWLMKSEPDVFSLADLARKGQAPWDGVRNYQARNYMMKEMQIGDQVLFYHSSVVPPGVAGLARVCSPAEPDVTAWDKRSEYFDAKSTPDEPRWYCVRVEFLETFRHFVTLEELRHAKELKNMLVLRRGQRLSIQPVTAQEFHLVCRLGRATDAN